MSYRQYYTAIKPMPPKAGPPLWKSPQSTPKKRKRTSEDRGFDASLLVEGEARATAVTNHVRKISRHRRRWEAPRTPPGYWDIGFPDTQETHRINERARAIHEEKMNQAEAESR